MAHLVGPKGQVVIEKGIRDRLGVGPGWQALQRVVDDHVEIYFIPPPHRRSLRGALATWKDPGVRVPATEEEFGEVCEQAWSQAAGADGSRVKRTDRHFPGDGVEVRQ